MISLRDRTVNGTFLASGISGNLSVSGGNEENAPGRDPHSDDRCHSSFLRKQGTYGKQSIFKSGGELLVKREDLHTRVTSEHKYYLKHYAELLNVQGKKMTIGMILDEALDCYGLEKRCKQEQEKTHGLFKS